MKRDMFMSEAEEAPRHVPHRTCPGCGEVSLLTDGDETKYSCLLCGWEWLMLKSAELVAAHKAEAVAAMKVARKRKWSIAQVGPARVYKTYHREPRRGNRGYRRWRKYGHLPVELTCLGD